MGTKVVVFAYIWARPTPRVVRGSLALWGRPRVAITRVPRTAFILTSIPRGVMSRDHLRRTWAMALQ
eukprot:7536920-Alexandrium_andersonii.AAC.1